MGLKRDELHAGGINSCETSYYTVTQMQAQIALIISDVYWNIHATLQFKLITAVP